MYVCVRQKYFCRCCSESDISKVIFLSRLTESTLTSHKPSTKCKGKETVLISVDVDMGLNHQTVSVDVVAPPLHSVCMCFVLCLSFATTTCEATVKCPLNFDILLKQKNK